MKNTVHGQITLDVSLNANAKEEQLALLEANYKLNNDLIIAYELTAINCKGERITIPVHNGVADLNMFVEV